MTLMASGDFSNASNCWNTSIGAAMRRYSCRAHAILPVMAVCVMKLPQVINRSPDIGGRSRGNGGSLLSFMYIFCTSSRSAVYS